MSSIPRPSLRIAVVGAGPAGLCAATALRQEGHIVTVIERQRSLQRRGNALVIQPAAVKALGSIKGAHEALSRVSVANKQLWWWSYKDSEPLAITQSVEKRFDTDRPSVQRVMHSLAIECGVEVLFGRNIVSITDHPVQPVITTSDGDSISADLIIGADGIKSAIRKQIFPGVDVDPITTREAIFLSSLPGSVIRGNKQLADRFAPGITHGTMGPGRFTLSRWLNDDIFGVQFVDVDHGEPSAVDSNWNTPADLGELRRLFSDFNSSTRLLLDNIQTAERWQIATGAKLETWRSRNGRIVLLGDAAHAMIPHAAQGLSQGIEDGVSLARVLRNTEACGISRAIDAWVNLRKPRAELFAQRSLNNAVLRSLPDGPQQELRDQKIKQLTKQASQDTANVVMDMHAEQNSPPFQKWMKEYDVVNESRLVNSTWKIRQYDKT
ncbi:hypothetical protein BB8028_0003g03240 [Beauveria bassiana]|uniref:FAD-binding domain-containing protein n=1 Tax=Beauveria bassiana TaxID=176275 RepID=A0A2S7Y6C8_BEABA|nr:hypothetical protein BB8028_0003g03240 [Beauveria bassiana]